MGNYSSSFFDTVKGEIFVDTMMRELPKVREILEKQAEKEEETQALLREILKHAGKENETETLLREILRVLKGNAGKGTEKKASPLSIGDKVYIVGTYPDTKCYRGVIDYIRSITKTSDGAFLYTVENHRGTIFRSDDLVLLEKVGRR